MGLHGLGILFVHLPSGGDGLPLGVELNGSLSVEVGSSPHRALVSSEGEHWEWDWDWEVDSDLSSFNLVLEFSSVGSRSSEDSNTVSVLVSVNDLDGLINGGGSVDHHNWGEDFFVIAWHTSMNLIDDGWSKPVSLWVSVNLVSSSVEQEFSSLGSRFNEFLGSLQGSGGLHWADIVVLFSWSNSQLLGLLNDLWDPFLSISNKDGDRDGHASLSSRSEAGTDQSVDGIFFLGVWHDDGVVLGSHVNLSSLSVLGRKSVDVLSSLVSSDEGDSLDVFMSTDVVDGWLSSMDNVDDSIRNSSFFKEINHLFSGGWDLFRWLEDVGVTTGNGQWEHPEWDHSWEVEWGNTSGDTEWDSVGLDVDVLGNILNSFSHDEGLERASVLNNFVSSEDISSGISKRLSVLIGDEVLELLLVGLDQFLILEHHSDLLGNRDFLP